MPELSLRHTWHAWSYAKPARRCPHAPLVLTCCLDRYCGSEQPYVTFVYSLSGASATIHRSLITKRVFEPS